MASLQLTSTLLGFRLAATIVMLLRCDHLYLLYGLFWLAVAFIAVCLGLWSGLIDRAASLVGIYYPPALLFLGAVILLTIKSLHCDIVNTHIERLVRRLNQRLAIYELNQSKKPSSHE